MVEFAKDELPDIEDRAEQAETKKLELLRRGKTREQAIDYGRLLGEDEANRRRETDDFRESRIRRAMMYAAWEFDGKPVGEGARYREEFGVAETGVAGSLERLASPRLLKRGKDVV
jgi:hypothetical protein